MTSFNKPVLGDVSEVSALTSRMNSGKKEALEKDLKKFRDKQTELQRELMEIGRQITRTAWDIERASNTCDPEELVNQILGISQVESMFVGRVEEVDGLFLCVYTKPLFVLDPRTNRKHILGPFKITLRIWPDNLGKRPQFYYNSLWFMCRGFRGETASHPHVWGDGLQCLGNVESDIYNMIDKGDIFGFTLMSILFLESVNVADSAGKTLNNWPWIPEGTKDEDIVDNLRINNPDHLFMPFIPVTCEHDKVLYARGLTEREWLSWVSKINTGNTDNVQTTPLPQTEGEEEE